MTDIFSTYDSSRYFLDLISFCLLLLPIYYLTSNEAARRALMVLSCMYLMYFIAPRLALFYTVFWIGVFLLQRLIARLEKKGRLTMPELVTALLLALLPMLMWKAQGLRFDVGFNLVTNAVFLFVSKRLWELDLAYDQIAPIGLSFATFRGVDLLIKTGLGKIGPLSFGRVMFYGFFPPVQIVGPIIEYEEVERQAAKADPSAILEGAFRIAVGALKVFLLAYQLRDSSEVLSAPHNYSVPALWGNLVCYTLYFYFNFSGYSDMAIGIAGMFGFKLKENFNFPFLQPNIREFWNSWHMSLSRWVQRNVFVPCGGYRPRTQYLALFLAIMTISMWHGTNLSMVVFGLYHFAGLVVHRMYSRGKPSPGMNERSALMTYLFVLPSFPLLTLPFDKALQFYAALIGL